MIRVQVSAVFQVRDGFTGKIVEGTRLFCRLDGAPVRLLSKPGGYLVATDLSAGVHSLLIRCAGFQDELLEFTVESGVREYFVALKPGKQYLFRDNVTRLRLRLPELSQGSPVWIAAPGYPECKLAQTKAEAGCVRFRIYCKGSAAQLPVPGAFLLEDGESSEVLVINSLSDEEALLGQPLRFDHGRSKRLLPVQVYRCDPEGEIYATFSRSGQAVVYTGSGKPLTQSLTEGENFWNPDE